MMKSWPASRVRRETTTTRWTHGACTARTTRAASARARGVWGRRSCAALALPCPALRRCIDGWDSAVARARAAATTGAAAATTGAAAEEQWTPLHRCRFLVWTGPSASSLCVCVSWSRRRDNICLMCVMARALHPTFPLCFFSRATTHSSEYATFRRNTDGRLLRGATAASPTPPPRERHSSRRCSVARMRPPSLGALGARCHRVTLTGPSAA